MDGGCRYYMQDPGVHCMNVERSFGQVLISYKADRKFRQTELFLNARFKYKHAVQHTNFKPDSEPPSYRTLSFVISDHAFDADSESEFQTGA